MAEAGGAKLPPLWADLGDGPGQPLDRTQKAYEALVLGKENRPQRGKAIEQSYLESKTDEFIEPTVILKGKKPVATINDNDAVIFLTFALTGRGN